MVINDCTTFNYSQYRYLVHYFYEILVANDVAGIQMVVEEAGQCVYILSQHSEILHRKQHHCNLVSSGYLSPSDITACPINSLHGDLCAHYFTFDTYTLLIMSNCVQKSLLMKIFTIPT